MRYSIQLSDFLQYEDDTRCHKKGDIEFTYSKGLVGVGVDRPVWETIRLQKAGEYYEHTVIKRNYTKGKK